MAKGREVWEDRQYKKKLDKNQKEITEKLDKLSGVTKESVYSGIIAATIVEAVSLLLVSMYSVTTKEIHEIYKRVVNMEEGLEKIAGLLGTEYGDYQERKIPDTWFKETYEKITKNKVSLGKDLDAMFGMLYEIDKLSIPEKQVEEKGWFGGVFKDFGSGASDRYNDFVNKLFPHLVWMKIPTEKELKPYSTEEKSFSEEEKSKLDEIKELNEDSKELIKGVIDKLIDQNYEETKKSIEELKTKQPEEEEGKASTDTSMIEGGFQSASPPADANESNIMDEIRNGFNNIMSAFAPQAGGRQADGEGKILTVSLTDESANNISTMIVQKQNEEKALEPAEVDKKGVTHDDLGIEIRDSKRSLQFDINEVKAKLDRLIKIIEEKAMTFDDIYNKLCLRMIREHRNATGRILR